MNYSIACLRCLKHIATSRGVCATCYSIQHKDIKSGKTTDEELVKSGQRDAALPKGIVYKRRYL